MANLIVTGGGFDGRSTYDTGIDISKINDIPNLEKVANETYRIQGLGQETLMRQLVKDTVNNALSDPITFQKNTLKNYTKNLVSLQNWRDIAPPPDRQTLIDGSRASINYLVNNKVPSDEINSLVNSSVKEFVDFENYKNEKIADLNKTTGFGGVPNPLANPLQTAALAAAYATNQTYLIPYINAAFALDAGQSPEKALQSAAVSYAATQIGSEVGAQTGSSVAGSAASGTAGGLLSGKSPEEALKGGAISGGVSLVTPSSLFTPSSSATTDYTPITSDPYAYVPELNIEQNTPSQASNVVVPTPTPTATPQGTTGATNMADYYTNDYESYGSQQPYTTQYPDYYRTTIAPESNPIYDYGNTPTDITGGEGFYDTGSAPYTQAQIDALTAQTYGGTSGFSSLDAATQALLKRALAAGGTAAQGAKNFLSSMFGGTSGANLLQGGLQTAGGLMQTQASRDAALKAQQDLLAATGSATAGSQFRPVGVTTRFGTSQFNINPATGQLESAGYTAAPEITSAQNRLLGLGASYLAQTPEEVAQQYLSKQYELLDPSRQRQLASIRNQAFQTGRGGLSVGSTGLRPSGAQGLMGTNPELEAYYNALAQQDAQLAAGAQQAGQQQVLYGAGLFGQAGNLENMAQQPFTLGTGLGTSISGAGANAGRLGLTGASLAAGYGTSPAATTSPGAYIASGLGSPTSTLGAGLANWLTSNAPTTGGITSQGMNAPTIDAYGNYVPLGYANY
jgi:hypothetical protein